MPEKQFFIGVTQVKACKEDCNGTPGYSVQCKDGYTHWHPKEEFERHYLPMPKGSDGSLIVPSMVDDFIADVQSSTYGQKTTVSHATLANGFELVESSSCVEPANYSQQQGEEICRERIESQVWKLLGFLLQAARNGFQATDDAR